MRADTVSEASVVFRHSPRRPERLPTPPARAPILWRDEEFRDWPPLEWPETPVRPQEPSRQAVWLLRALIVVGLISVGVFFGWLLDPEKRGDAWLFWPLVAALAYRAMWWVVEWLNYRGRSSSRSWRRGGDGASMCSLRPVRANRAGWSCGRCWQ